MWRRPPIASPIAPKPGWSRYGPVCPKPEMRSITSPGLMRESSSQPTPHSSSVPGRKFSINTSASATSCRRSSCPSALRRSTAIERLFRDCTCHHTEVPSLISRQLRSGSPLPGGSILMTSAPKSPRILPQKGPAISCPSSTMRTPARTWGEVAMGVPSSADDSARGRRAELAAREIGGEVRDPCEAGSEAIHRAGLGLQAPHADLALGRLDLGLGGIEHILFELEVLAAPAVLLQRGGEFGELRLRDQTATGHGHLRPIDYPPAPRIEATGRCAPSDYRSQVRHACSRRAPRE